MYIHISSMNFDFLKVFSFLEIISPVVLAKSKYHAFMHYALHLSPDCRILYHLKRGVLS